MSDSDSELDLLSLAAARGGAEAASSSSLAEVAPPEAIVVAPQTRPPGRGRGHGIAFVDGKRVRGRQRLGKRPYSKGEAMGSAREAKLKKVIKNNLKSYRSVVQVVVSDIAAKSKVRMSGEFFKNVKARMRLCKLGALKENKLFRKQFSCHQWVAMAANDDPCRNSIARSFDTTAKTVRRAISSGGLARLVSQELLLLELERDVIEDPPDFSACTPLWDETGEKLRLTLGELTLSNTWDVLVFSCEFVWGWFDSSRKSKYFRALVPPMLLTLKSAANLWSTLETHSWTKLIVRFRNALLSATRHFRHCVCTPDSVGTNLKVVAHSRVVLKKLSSVDRLPCFNHQVQLGDMTTTVSCYGIELLNNHFASVQFMKMGNHTARFALSVGPYVDEHMDFPFGAQPAEDKLYIDELTSYLASWHATKQGRHLVAARCNGFLKNVNGGFFDKSGKLRHYSTVELSDEEKDSIRTSTKASIQALLYGEGFKSPSAGKWAKTGPSLDQRMVGMLCDLQCGLFRQATSKMLFKAGESEQIETEFAFNTIAGKYCRRAGNTYSSDDENVKCVFFVLADEAYRALALYFMSVSETKFPKEGAPPICTVTNPRASFLYQVWVV